MLTYLKRVLGLGVVTVQSTSPIHPASAAPPAVLSVSPTIAPLSRKHWRSIVIAQGVLYYAQHNGSKPRFEVYGQAIGFSAEQYRDLVVKYFTKNLKQDLRGVRPMSLQSFRGWFDLLVSHPDGKARLTELDLLAARAEKTAAIVKRQKDVRQKDETVKGLAALMAAAALLGQQPEEAKPEPGDASATSC